MGKHKEVSCKICFKPMRSDNVTRHMKIHLKYTPKGVLENEEIQFKLVNNVVEEKRSDVTIKCHEAGEIDAKTLERKNG